MSPRLSRSGECRQTDRRNPEVVKREGCKEEGILVVYVNDDRLNWDERELVRNLGKKLYGIGNFSAAGQ